MNKKSIISILSIVLCVGLIVGAVILLPPLFNASGDDEKADMGANMAPTSSGIDSNVHAELGPAVSPNDQNNNTNSNRDNMTEAEKINRAFSSWKMFYGEEIERLDIAIKDPAAYRRQVLATKFTVSEVKLALEIEKKHFVAFGTEFNGIEQMIKDGEFKTEEEFNSYMNKRLIARRADADREQTDKIGTCL